MVDTDASNFAMGAVLSQHQQGQEKVLAYFSKSFSKEERNNCVTRRELLAIVSTLKQYHHYLYGSKITVRTDHGALRWLLSFKKPEGQLARWLEIMGTYNIEIQHRPGRIHNNADALSRRPCTDCRFCSAKEAKDEAAAEDNSEASSHKIRAVDRSISPVVEPWPKETLLSWQEDDTDVAEARKWLVGGKRPEWSDVRGKSNVVKRLWAMYNELCLVEQLIYCQIKDKSQGESAMRLVAPQILRKETFQMLHCNRTAAHMGMRKTLANIQRRFWWPGIKEDVERMCCGCSQCQKRNPRSDRHNAPLVQCPAGAPWERIAMDILSIPVTLVMGKTCILVVSDHFSKWTEAFALEDHRAVTIADVLVTEEFCRFGVPTFLHSDQDPEFQAELMKEICKLLNITQTRTTPCHPQSDGQVERFNRTLLNLLAKLCEDEPEQWEDHLPYVMFAYWSTVHDSTGCTPNSLIFGRETNMPIDVMFTPPDETYRPKCQVEYVEWVREALQRNCELARENLGQAAVRQKTNYDLKAAPRNISVGDWVLCYYPPAMIGNKLSSPFRGPYLVVAQPNDVTFTIQANRTEKAVTVHVNDLKRFWGDNHPASWLPNRNIPVDPVSKEGEHGTSDCNMWSDEDHYDPNNFPMAEPKAAPQTSTRSKRVIRPPKRFGWD